jgi:hypothetical protein
MVKEGKGKKEQGERAGWEWTRNKWESGDGNENYSDGNKLKIGTGICV